MSTSFGGKRYDNAYADAEEISVYTDFFEGQFKKDDPVINDVSE